jgi:hypothetical protein
MGITSLMPPYTLPYQAGCDTAFQEISEEVRREHSSQM